MNVTRGATAATAAAEAPALAGLSAARHAFRGGEERCGSSSGTATAAATTRKTLHTFETRSCALCRRVGSRIAKAALLSAEPRPTPCACAGVRRSG